MVAAAVVGGAIVGGVASNMAGNKAADAQRDAAKQASETELQMYNQNREDLTPYREAGYSALGEISKGLGLPGGISVPNQPGSSAPLSFQDWMKANPSVGVGPGGKVMPHSGGMTGMIQGALAMQQQKQSYDQYVKNFKPTMNGPGAPGGTPAGYFSHDFGMADFQKDPGYQFRMNEGEKALLAGQSATGGTQNGATLKALQRYGQDYASGEYSSAYSRFNNDRTTRFNRLSSVAGIGQTAATTTGQMGSQAAGRIGENQLQAGNSRAASAINTGNAINSTVGSLGQFYLQQQYMKNAGSGGIYV